MMKKVLSLMLSVISMAMISGCGGDSLGDKELKLTVGSKIITSSNTERETIRIKNNTRSIATVKSSDPFCDISLDGKDADRFEYDSDRLFFKESVDIFNPRDYDKDNGYELDITTSCDDGRSITYKVEYKVTSDEDFLKGHTYYVVNGENNYTMYGFADSDVTIKEYTITKTSQVNHNEISSNTYQITYADISYSYNGQTCKLVSSNPLKARCGSKTIDFLKDIPNYVIPSNFFVTATSSDIQNLDDDGLNPIIKSFKMAGNSSAENHRVIIDKSKADNSFIYTIEVSMYATDIYSQFSDSNKSIHWTRGVAADKKKRFDCQYIDDNNGLHYKCNNINMDTNSSGDTNIEVYACNGSDANASCSYASLPVLFR